MRQMSSLLVVKSHLFPQFVHQSYTVKKGVLMSTLINLSLSMRCSAAPWGVILTHLNGLECPTDTPRDVGYFLTLLRVGMNISMMD